MHKNRILADIISMEVLNLEIINLNRSLKYFMLYLFNNDILTVAEYKYISCFEINSTCPSTLWRIERMGRCGDYLITVYMDMYKLGRFINKCLKNLFVSAFSGFRIRSKYTIFGPNLFDMFLSVFVQN